MGNFQSPQNKQACLFKKKIQSKRKELIESNPQHSLDTNFNEVTSTLTIRTRQRIVSPSYSKLRYQLNQRSTKTCVVSSSRLYTS